MHRRALIIVLALALAGCSSSNVDVNVDNDRRDRHEKVFDEELGPRSGDYEKAQVFLLQPATYSPATLALDVRGIVMIKLLIAADGEVLDSQVVQSVHPEVDRAAADAALRSRFRPARQNDIAVDSWLTVPYRFPPESE